MTDRADEPSRTIDDIDLRVPSPQVSVHLDPPVPRVESTGERLARVERLLDADLAALGPSVVTASIAEITSRLDALAARIDEVGARWEGEADEQAGPLAGVERRLDRLDTRLDRLTRLVEAATEPEPEGVVSPTDAALAGLGSTLDDLVSRFEALARRLD